MTHYTWSVIGAGPAGILAVGKLIENGVNPQSILWIDPEFKAGDLGSKWQNVPSNTKVGLFIEYLMGCQAFSYKHHQKEFKISQLDPNHTCLLSEIVAPLQAETTHLLQKVSSHLGYVDSLEAINGLWHIYLADQVYHSKNVILAHGSEPKSLPYQCHKTISLEKALNQSALEQEVEDGDIIGVFGASHSAVLVIKNLVELNKQIEIINFYTKPFKYAVYFEDWILFDDTGLKAETADWARKHIEANPPKNLKRIWVDDNALETYLPECQKLIYAIGFQRRHRLVLQPYPMNYNANLGIIAPGLFGLGIAFPKRAVDRYGNIEYRVGLYKFLKDFEEMYPIWQQYAL